MIALYLFKEIFTQYMVLKIFHLNNIESHLIVTVMTTTPN